MRSPLEKVAAIRAATPAEGLFADKDWLLSPEPFGLPERQIDELEKLGYRLALFQRACNVLYHQSVKGKQPAWIADYLDAGKPRELVEFSRRKEFREDLPLIIRPDLVLTDANWTIAELDTVPGGIGLTAWLNQTYSALGYDVIGGPRGMLEGFGSLLPDGGDILIAQEAATYRPEMEWLAHQLSGEKKFRVCEAETYQLSTNNAQPPRAAYRFFELFDLPNIPAAPAIMHAAANGTLKVTPPFKPFMEEKMWFALFWLRPLRDFWRRELRDHHYRELQKVIPYTWIVDPQPLPHHAVLPGLEIHDWRELAAFSQKERELVMKVSGFSELGWGGRGVSVAQDLPQREWAATIERALASIGTAPRILQRFHKGRLYEQRFVDPQGELRTMTGRVRLCPYFFIEQGKAVLRGALATICPPDKKLLHGMRDAVITCTHLLPAVD